jgi:hypothetical protein
MLIIHKFFHVGVTVGQNRVSNRNYILFLRFADMGLIPLIFIARTFYCLHAFTVLDSNTVR